LYLFINGVKKLTVEIIEGYPLLTTCKILSHVLDSKLTPYVDEINGDYQHGF